MTAITSNGTGGGVWSAGASWTGAAVPVEGDTVIIQNGDTITIDQTITVGADTTTAAIDVASGGKLEVLSTVAANYILTLKGDLKISAGGTLEIGTVVNPIPAARKFEIKLNYSAALADGKYGLLNSGEMILQGDSKKSWTLLTADVAGAGTVLTVGDTTGWEAGDKLGIASTSTSYTATDNKIILTVDSATQVTLTAGVSYAHLSGAEVINLTRNIKITSYDTSYRGYVYCLAGSTSDVDYVEYYMLGYYASNKFGLTIATTVENATSIRYSSFWGQTACIDTIYVSGSYVILDYNVGYGVYRQFVNLTGTYQTLTNNVFIRTIQTGISGGVGGVYITYGNGDVIQNNVVNATYHNGFYMSATVFVDGFSSNKASSCRGAAFYCINMKKGGLIDSLDVLNSSTDGAFYLNNCIQLTFTNCSAAGSVLKSMLLVNTVNCVFDTFSAPAGTINFATSHNLNFLFKDSTIYTFNFAYSDYFHTIKLHNTNLTDVSGMNINTIGSYIQCEDLGQVAYADKAWYRNGIVVRDGTTFKYGSYATRFDFQYNNAEWLDYDVYIPVKNGEQIVVSAWLRKNASYTDANRPKITISGQDITEDSAQMSDVTDTWERVTVSGTPTRTGLAKLTISTYLVNAGASAWVDFNKTDILSGVLNTIEGDFWANGHIAEVFMDTGSITAAEFWKTLTADVDLAGCFGNLFKSYVDAAISGRAPANEYDAELTAIQADLNNPAQYKADVSNLDVAVSTRAPANEYDTQMGYIPSNLADVPTAAELIAAHGSGSWEGTTPADVADAVWDEVMSGHTTSGTFGSHIKNKLLTVAKFIGLK